MIARRRRRPVRRALGFLALLLVLAPVAVCGPGAGGEDGEPFRILSASENETLEPLVRRWSR